VFQSENFRVGILRQAVQSPVLHSVGFPEEAEETPVPHRLDKDEGVAADESPRESSLRQYPIEVVPRVSAVNRNGRNSDGIHHYNRVPRNGTQREDSAALRFVHCRQVAVLLSEGLDEAGILGAESLVLLRRQFEGFDPRGVQRVADPVPLDLPEEDFRVPLISLSLGSESLNTLILEAHYRRSEKEEYREEDEERVFSFHAT